MNVQQRKVEAERIAQAEGFAVTDHEADWTYFTLDDGQLIGENGTDGRGFLAGRTIRTHFEWVEESGRFEGFVS